MLLRYSKTPKCQRDAAANCYKKNIWSPCVDAHAPSPYPITTTRSFFFEFLHRDILVIFENVVFASLGEKGLIELNSDFKFHFHDRHDEFYCSLNTTMMETDKF
jgi:hypothetical protein